MILLSFPRNEKDQKNKELAYISKAYSAWKNTKCFFSLQDSFCQKASSVYYLIAPECNDIGEMIDDQIT